MTMRGRRRSRPLAMGALLVAVLAPGIAEAQLFPNLPTRKREKIDCSQELPVYGLYRHKYYGYYPTCWRRFPPGWGCPTPEAPDWEAELANRPLDIPDEGDFGAEGPGGLAPDPFGGGSGLDDLLPDLPQRERSPFDLDRGNGGASPFDPPQRGGNSPFDADPFAPGDPGETSPDRSSPQPSPFDLPGASNTPSEVPSLSPPVSETSPASSREGPPVAAGPRQAGVPELAVLPNARPRPVRLPSMESGSIPYPADLPPGTAPIGMDLGSIPPGTSFPMVEGQPGVLDPATGEIIISDSAMPPSGPILMGGPEERPRRRFLSGLFNRRR
jgi:hypothetical protein